MRPLAKCEFLFRFSPDSCGYLRGVPGENIGHFRLIFLENARILALLRDHENVLRHQPFCAITFPLLGISRPLSCAHSHRLVSPQRQSILWRCCYFTSGNNLTWEDSAEKTMRLSVKLSTQGMTGRGGDRRCDSGDSPCQGMGLAFPCPCRRHLL